MKEYTDTHHINPTLTALIPHKKHQKLHHNVPVTNDLNLKMRQYDKLVKLSVMFKNWKWAYKREFGQLIDISLNEEEIEAQKKKVINGLKVLLLDKKEKTKHIKGLGIRYLAGMLAYADPKRFPTVGRYLYYCGYTKASKLTKKYSRKVCSLVYQIVNCMIKAKDERYYHLYLKIKQEQAAEFPKFKKHRIAINRVGTLFLKEFYNLFKE